MNLLTTREQGTVLKSSNSQTATAPESAFIRKNQYESNICDLVELKKSRSTLQKRQFATIEVRFFGVINSLLVRKAKRQAFKLMI